MPIGVPPHWVVAFAGQERRLIGAPCDRKLVFSSEVSDASKIENDDRMQRILSFCPENVVVDERDQCVEHDEHGNESERQPL